MGVDSLDERRLRIAGLEIALRAPGALVDELLGRWRGYASLGGTPDIVHEFHADAAFVGADPPGVEFPGYGCRALGPTRYAFERADGRGTIDVPDEGPVVGTFGGLAARFAVEASLRLAVSLALPRLGGLMIHSSGLADAEGRAGRLFSGPSGVGKTTISRLLGELPGFSRRLGDDLTVVRPDGDGFRLHATPFAGELGPADDGSAPLVGIHFLAQAPRHRAARLSVGEGVRHLLRNTMAHVREARGATRVLTAASTIAASVPCWRLEFARDAGVARVVEELRYP